MQVFVIGYPSSLGGADTELWHVLKLWRARGVDVTLVPTWVPPAGWQARCDAIGVRTVRVDGPEEFRRVPGLAGAVVVSFCNGQFLAHAAAFRELGCRIVWAGCMSYLFNMEMAHYREHGPFDAYVFQSAYQQQALQPNLAEYGVGEETCFHIPGAFDVREFPFRPREHRDGEPFVIGRLSRVDRHKWPDNTWEIWESISYRPLAGRIMGWDEQLEAHLGKPPAWVEALSACSEPPHRFLSSLHCLFGVNGLAIENWPRVGLEAMATGVPLIADRRGGWPEMIDHGVTGFLVDRAEEASAYADELASDEEARLEIARCARQRVESELAEPERIGAEWHRLFASLKTPSQTLSCAARRRRSGGSFDGPF